MTHEAMFFIYLISVYGYGYVERLGYLVYPLVVDYWIDESVPVEYLLALVHALHYLIQILLDHQTLVLLVWVERFLH